MICEKEKYHKYVDALNHNVLSEFNYKYKICCSFLHLADYCLADYSNSQGAYDAVSYVYNNDKKIRFCLRIDNHRKEIIDYLEANLDLKRIKQYKNSYRKIFYCMETDDADVLYTVCKMMG